MEDRRSFLKKAGIVGSAFVLGLNPLMSTGKNSMVKIAIVGTGSRGKFLLNFLLSIQKENPFEITALCDNYTPNLTSGLKQCTEQGVDPATYSDFRKMIAEHELDGVVITTPLHTHAEIAVYAMKAGIHVMCEKAMARTLEDTKQMLDVQQATGKILLIGHQRTFNPKYIQAMAQIHAGKLGTIGQIKAYWHRNNDWRRKVPEGKPELEKQINWRLYREFSAGLFTELMTHQLQVANWALQASPVSVRASGSIRFWKDGREVEDNIAVIFSYADGTQFIYDSMTSNSLIGVEEQIMGSKGMMELESNRVFWEASEKKEHPSAIAQLSAQIKKGKAEPVMAGGSSWKLEEAAVKADLPILENASDDDGSALLMAGFIKFLQGEKFPLWLTYSAYEASAWTLLAEEAMLSGKTLSMPEKYQL
ncbi:Gfo/Idh/MocA family oxidoreductase [Persicobacter psychrovividus]|uniref:Oxidoreductase n=1 Tax=Persicobacter psychrovividus TaxID=387638 RepID=A0ABM7VM26_9BACT|nr:oxidoreductase [Persicobacter psychrovividus]